MSSGHEETKAHPEAWEARWHVAMTEAKDRLAHAPDRIPDDIGLDSFLEVTRRAAEVGDAELDIIHRNLIGVLHEQGLLKDEAFERVEETIDV